jgi:LysR family transcriptional regulator, glycine cleavage system transcriptional activator
MLRQLVPSANALFVFEAVARHCSFSRAADEFNVTQPAISRMIARLEAYLDARLFDRSGSKVALTENGELLFRAVADGFHQIRMAMEQLETRRTGKEIVTLSLSSAMTTHWLMPRLSRLYEKFPDIEIRFHLIAGEPVGSVESVDLGVRLASMIENDVHRWPLVDEVIHAVCSPHYLAERGSLDRPGPLDGHTFISLNTPRITWDEFLGQFGIDPGIAERTLVFSDYSVVIQAAANGQGIALGWISAVSHLFGTRILVPALDRPLRTGRQYHVVASKRKPLRDTVVNIRDWMIAEMQSDIRQVEAVLSA